MHKTCKVHGILESKDIYKSKTEKYNRCKICVKAKNKKNYVKNRLQRLDSALIYREENKEKIMLWARNDRAANKEKYRLQSLPGHNGYKYSKRFREVLRARGLTQEKYDVMLLSQNNLCAICQRPETRKDPKNPRVCRLCIDHCHETGKARALLCHSCNTGIGKFRENIAILKSAIAYLEKHA